MRRQGSGAVVNITSTSVQYDFFMQAIPQEGSDGSDQKARQKAFFTDIYQLLFARSAGPRLGTFLAAVPKSDYRKLLDA